jgi:hypothetical protein
VEDVDLDAYYRIYCDPAMMTELGGAVPREDVREKLCRHVALTAGDELWTTVRPTGSAARSGSVWPVSRNRRSRAGRSTPTTG